MEAIVYEEYGGPEVMHLAEVEEPHPGPGQVRLRVRAAGVNPFDYKVRNGWMRDAFTVTFPKIPGGEAAGVVDEVGEGVTDLAVGDEVLGFMDTGAYATYALSSLVVRKPAQLGWGEAAGLPTAAETAQRVLDLLAVNEGETLLVHGAGGSVGSVGAQLAGARGVTVIGTASPDKHDHLRSQGIVPVTYGDGLVDRVRAVAPQGVDAVFDAAGKGALPDSVALLHGATVRIVTIADPDAARYGVTFSAVPRRNREALTEHVRLAAEGKLQITITGTFPLAEAAEALTLSETGRARGKLVLRP